MKLVLGMELGLSPGDFVLHGDPDPLPKKGAEPPQFSLHVYCSQTAAWIKMPLAVEVGLGLVDFVFDGEPATPEKGHTHPRLIFGACLLWPNGSMDQDATWYGGKPRPRRRCVVWGCNSSLKVAQPPSFRFMSIMAK